MAARKPITNEDVQVDESAEPQSFEDRVAEIEENTDSSVLAEVEDVDYVKVTSPAGSVTTVPKGIVDVLLGSGYSKSK